VGFFFFAVNCMLFVAYGAFSFVASCTPCRGGG